MGIAMGVMHIAYDDFCRLTPDEFAAVHEAYARDFDAQHRDKWERTRMAAWFALQPYMKKGTRPERMFPLPWDKTTPMADKPRRKAETKAEHLRRFKQVLVRTGEG